MSDQQHRGVRPAGPFTQPSDRRVLELDEGLRKIEAVTPGLAEFARDSTRSAQTIGQKLAAGGPIVRGTVIHPLPSLHWYKVQLGGGMGTVAARFGMPGGLTPSGPRSLSMARPNDDVLVMVPPGVPGIILCVLPPAITDKRLIVPDWILQGSGAGVLREEAHQFPVKGTYRAGGVVNYGANRPIDQTGAEDGWITASGIAILIDEWMAMMRVNEQCGLFMTLQDSWCRLAGVQLLIESSIHEEEAGDDEGEAHYFRGIAAYPWEALGQPEPGTRLTTTNADDDDVQFKSHKGKRDLAYPDQQPAYRYVEHAGYLGQGGFRAVVLPADQSRHYRNATPDIGLFRESIGLDGAYSLLSAKSVHIGKRCTIIVPKQTAPIENGTGDDAAAGGYKFSSKFGSGPDHKVGDVKVSGELQSLRKVAGVMDLIAYATNWQALHPFHYHTADYSTPQEGDLPFGKTQDKLNFSPLATGGFMAEPTAVRVKVDHRYGQVSYYRRESFLRFEDDGSVHMGGGGGESMVFANGNGRISMPGRFEVVAGTDVTVFAGGATITTKGSIDIASDKDVRIKSERNLQVLSGNSGQGGMLFESKGKGSSQRYENLYGEDVQSSGIVFKASQGVCAMLGRDIYLRTGGEGLGEGDILLDASRGKRRCQIYSREFNVYSQKAVSFFYGPLESNSDVTKVYYFGDTTAIMDVQLLLKGQLINYGDSSGVITKGGVYGLKSFATAGVMADKKGMFLGKVPSGFAGILTTATDQAKTATEKLKEVGKKLHELTVVKQYYASGQMGDDKLIASLAFSFRDPPKGREQYGAKDLKWVESRWQQMARFGLASGGVVWAPKPVLYQGAQTRPFPGQKKWQEEKVFLRLATETMFDSTAGHAKDRPAPYESPTIGDWDAVPMAKGFTLTR